MASTSLACTGPDFLLPQPQVRLLLRAELLFRTHLLALQTAPFENPPTVPLTQAVFVADFREGLGRKYSTDSKSQLNTRHSSALPAPRNTLRAVTLPHLCHGAPWVTFSFSLLFAQLGSPFFLLFSSSVFCRSLIFHI